LSVKRDNRSAIYFRVGENDAGLELFHKLEEYRLIKGWTWKRLCLQSIAEYVYEENPLLAKDIAEFLIKKSTTNI